MKGGSGSLAPAMKDWWRSPQNRAFDLKPMPRVTKSLKTSNWC